MRLDVFSEREVRLAYEQGLLRGRSVTPYQRWALEYMLSLKRWFIAEVQQSALKDLLYLLDPKRWRELYLPPVIDDGTDQGVPQTPDDIDEIEKMLAEIDNGARRTVVASQLPGAGEDGWF